MNRKLAITATIITAAMNVIGSSRKRGTYRKLWNLKYLEITMKYSTYVEEGKIISRWNELLNLNSTLCRIYVVNIL
jgi:hypothetical protein